LTTACLDIDGVLCIDPTEEQTNDAEKYIEFILNAQPLFIPSRKVYALVTSRSEKYREQTEIWLKKYKVEYEYLIMQDLPGKEGGQKQISHAKHKALFYQKSSAELFIESDYKQSIEINHITKKPVFCAASNQIINNGFYNLKHEAVTSLKERLASFIPRGIKNQIKKLY
ncbi:hypothetical protein, partial [Pseudoalteromonas nigrifaciens]